jgi:tRNA-splicing ligase RtcB
MAELFKVLMSPEQKVPIKAWIAGVPLEESAEKQLKNMAAMPFIHSHIAIMPDVHWGMGATVGSVIPTSGAIIPAAVGVDIGCGMIAQRTSLRASDLPDNLHALRTAIERRIPHGRTNDGKPGDRGAWNDVPPHYEQTFKTLWGGLQKIVAKHPKIAQAADRAVHHIGTLGGGNHFVEVCLDEHDAVWIMLHSGSRGIGNRIGSYFIQLAKEDMRRYHVNLPDVDLAYIPQGSPLFNDYMEALGWAQGFAKLNRALMMEAALEALKEIVPKEFKTDCEAVNCHHNYVAQEHHFGQDVFVTRKGAVRITETEMGIIPGSMGAKSFIVKAKKGSPLALAMNSCSHGAGRAMSRTQAKKQFTLEDHNAAMGDIEARRDADVIDETPGAYKDIDAVMAAQADHVEIVHTLRQVVCVKG